MAAKVLVDGVVDDFPNEMMKTRAVVDISDVHARTLPDRLETFEDSDALAAVSGRGLRLARNANVGRHGGGSLVAEDGTNQGKNTCS
jgi:hypothetical protein